MEPKGSVPGDTVTTTTDVEPNQSPPPEGTVLPKLPFTAIYIGGILLAAAFVVFAVSRNYINIFQ